MNCPAYKDSMDSIFYIDRTTQKKESELVFGSSVINFFYGDSFYSKTFGRALLKLVAKYPGFSKLYGWWQHQSWSKRQIDPFIKKFGIDASEFQLPVKDFTSFNDFFTRHLKPEARPIFPGSNVAIIPADGRYLFFPRVDLAEGFIVKGKKFDLAAFLDDSDLAAKYAQGAMFIARLCPTDYHRFHFPADCIPGPAKLINGWLYSVNPIAIKKNIEIFSQNKRTVTQLDSSQFGKILYVEVGATNVGSIVQTYQPGNFYPKGAEKGYFSFGGSTLIILFEPETITFDEDLVKASKENIEIRCLLGQSLGMAKNK